MTADEIVNLLEEVVGPAPNDFVEAIKEEIDPELAAERDQLLIESARIAKAWYELGQKMRAQKGYVN